MKLFTFHFVKLTKPPPSTEPEINELNLADNEASDNDTDDS